jgi:4,5-DOPA dioxygenase extradiol
MTAKAKQLPAIFLGHGSPMNTLESNRYTQAWRQLGETIPRPRAILAISAHWQTEGTAVTAMERPRTIHDFRGFPKPLFDVEYPATGDPALAARVAELLAPTQVSLDQSWGLDHGTWSVLVHVYPKADVPVIQLSLDATQPASYHYEIGTRLAPLRDEGVLVLGSGNVVHNLRVINFSDPRTPYDWAERFNSRVRELLEKREHEPLTRYQEMGRDALLSVPTPEHFLPLLYILGMQQKKDAVTFPVDGIDLASISMLSVKVGG